MMAATPGISACRDIGEGPPCGGRWLATFCTPAAWRCGAGGAAWPALRSAVSATIATSTPGMARTAASAAARTLSQARASAASTLMEKNTLPSLAVTGDSTLALVKATPRGEATLANASRTCCCVTPTGHLLSFRPCPGKPTQLSRPDVVPAHRRRRSALFFGGLVIQLDHHAIGVVDEDLPEVAARNLPRVERHALGLQPRFHGVKTPADEGHVMNHAGIRL